MMKIKKNGLFATLLLFSVMVSGCSPKADIQYEPIVEETVEETFYDTMVEDEEVLYCPFRFLVPYTGKIKASQAQVISSYDALVKFCRGYSDSAAEYIKTYFPKEQYRECKEPIVCCIYTSNKSVSRTRCFYNSPGVIDIDIETKDESIGQTYLYVAGFAVRPDMIQDDMKFNFDVYVKGSKKHTLASNYK